MIPNIDIKQTGLTVATFHSMMLVLHLPVDRKEQMNNFAGPQTLKAIRDFQKKNQLPIDEKFVADEPTIQFMVAMLRQHGFITNERRRTISGIVKNSNGRGLSNMMLVACDLDLKGVVQYKKVEIVGDLIKLGDGFEFLGSASANQNGNYEIEYYDWMYAKSERRGADVVVFAVRKSKSQPKDPVIGRSALFQNVGLNTEGVDIIAEEIARKQGEYKLLLKAINTFLKENEMSLKDIFDATDQILFVAAELEIPLEKVQMIVFANARNHGVNGNLEAELLYGLGRQKINLDWNSLHQNSVAVLTEALAQAMEEKDIDSFSEKEIDEFIDILKTITASKTLEPQGNEPNIANEVLAIALSRASERVAFIKASNQYTGTNEEEFWNSYLPEQTGFKANTIRSLRATQKIFTFSGAYLPVVTHLAKANIKELPDLVQWDLGDWQNLVKKTGVPSYVNGANEEEKMTNYATFLRDNVNHEFSTQAVQHKINTKIIPIENNDLLETISKFLSTEDFDIKLSNINDFKDSIDNDDAILELRELQRLVRINPDTSLIPVLKANGLTSAFKIVEYDRKTFVLEYSKDLGGTQKALMIYQNASVTNASVSLAETAMIQHLIGFFPEFTLDPEIIDRTRTLVEERFPGYSQLFNVNLCECKHCNSVYGPAAYFVDLMRFLQKGTTNEEGDTPSMVFKKRRPDLFHLPLTCENSNTLIPYIDLANEVMENYIFYTHNDDTDVDFEQFKSSDIDGTTAEELRAQPQHIQREAYRILAEEAVYPTALPYNLPLKTLNAYSKQLGSSWYDILETTFQFEKSETNDNILHSNLLGLSEIEFAAITRQDFDGDNTLVRNYWDYFGFNSATALNNGLSAVPKFLESTGLQYTEMIALFQTGFINPNLQFLAFMESIVKDVVGLDGRQIFESLKAVATSGATLPDEIILALNEREIGIDNFREWVSSEFDHLSQAITLFEETSACDISNTVIKSVANLYESPNFIWTESLALNINAFLRLWHKTNWSMEILDTLLVALDISAFNPENLRELGAAKKFIDKTAIEPKQAAVLWGNMGSWHKNSLYTELFLSKTMELNPIFRMQPGRAPFEDIQDDGIRLKISNNIAEIQAALNVEEADLRAIFQHTEIDVATANISLRDLSMAYRYILFAEIFDISISDLIHIIQLFELQPFTSPQDSLEALDIINAINNSNFTVTDLGVLFSPDTVEYQNEFPEIDAVNKLGLSVQHEYEEINNREIAVAPADVEAERLQLKQTFTYNTLGDFINISSPTIQALAESEIDDLIGSFSADNWVVLVNSLYKSALAIIKFELTDDEANYFINNPSAFDNPNLKNLTQTHWLQLNDYVTFKENLSSNTLSPISILEYASQGSSSTIEGFGAEISKVTGWAEADVIYLLNRYSDITEFKIVQVLLSLQEVHSFTKRIGINPESLFDLVPENWSFSTLWEKAQTIKRLVKSKYSRTNWNTVATKLNDALREKQRDALVAYLLSMEHINDREIKDVNGLYEFFLIDVQMSACMDTSRIVQASAAVQQFVNRIHLNLEDGVAQNALNKNRWQWMKHYRVWEAQMRIWYENPIYLKPEWRMDKTEFFKELESHLTQNDITDRTAEQALRGYLKSMDEVANLNVAGMYEEKDDLGNKKLLHVFGHTNNTAYKYFYRTYHFKYDKWSTWTKVDAAIQSVVNTEDDGKSGVHLIPVVWKNRLLLFWPEFIEKAEARSTTGKSFQALSLETPKEPNKYWEVRLAWSELYDGKWTAKQVSEECLSISEELVYYGVGIRNINLSNIAFNVNFNEDGNSFEIYLSPNMIDNGQGHIGISYEFSADERTANMLSAHNSFKISNLSHKISATIGRATLLTGLGGYLTSYEERPFIDDSLNGKFRNISLSSYSYDFMKTNQYKKALRFGNTYLRNSKMHQLLFSNKLEYIENPTEQPFFYISEDKTYFVNEKFTRTNIGRSGSSTGGSAFGLDGSPNIGINLPLFVFRNKLNFSTFHHPFVSDFISNLNKNGIGTNDSEKPGLMDSDTLLLTEIRLPYDDKGETFEEDFDPNFDYVYKPDDLEDSLSTYYKETIDFASNGANSKYNWELFFHAPLYIATQLSKNGKFEEALKWFHYIFDPTTDEIPDWGLEEVSRFWKVKPFKHDVGDSFEEFINNLTANSETEDPRIEEWRENPFNPHLVATNFPVNYKKYTLLAYVENLVEWADSKFRKFTRENVYEAIQLYVMASHILGPKPPFVPSRGTLKKETFDTLDGKLNDLSNARVEMENSIGYSSSIHDLDETDAPAISGTGLAFYFCVPPNEKLLKYWEIVEDRLYKIRNCKDINGVARRLALFAPPIDPALLIQATSAGLDLDTILSELNTPNPHYRFAYLLQKANEFCNDVKGLGNALLSAIEKQDNEALGQLRSTHEITMLNMLQGVKERQVLDARIIVEQLEKQRVTATSRFTYYNETLLGNESVDIPQVISLSPKLTEDSQISINSPIQEIVPDVNTSLEDGRNGIRIIPKEKEDINKRSVAMDLSLASGVLDTLAGAMALIPQFNANVQPIGVGVSTGFGGRQLSSAMSLSSTQLKTISSHYSQMAGMASTTASYIRREQEWTNQANLVIKEIEQLEIQILSAGIRLQVAEKDLENHKRQIVNAKAIEAYLKDKFSNKELYTWMKDQLTSLHKKSFDLAFEMAKKAELAFEFEKGPLGDAQIIEYSYWDNSRYGLLAGEKLQLALRKLEVAYQEENRRQFELTKHVSLKLLQPIELIRLRETGRCSMRLFEELFDLDYPGHYNRRIKSVSMSIPCVAGPYTSIPCTLRLGSNFIRTTADLSVELQERNIPVDAIATSSGQNDSGVYELNFRDERYVPFEGAGVISDWVIELFNDADAEDFGNSLRQFDYDTISDVIMHLRYTAEEDGDLKTAALENLKEYFEATDGGSSPFYKIFDLKHDFPPSGKDSCDLSIRMVKIRWN